MGWPGQLCFDRGSWATLCTLRYTCSEDHGSTWGPTHSPLTMTYLEGWSRCPVHVGSFRSFNSQRCILNLPPGHQRGFIHTCRWRTHSHLRLGDTGGATAQALLPAVAISPPCTFQLTNTKGGSWPSLLPQDSGTLTSLPSERKIPRPLWARGRSRPQQP